MNMSRFSSLLAALLFVAPVTMVIATETPVTSRTTIVHPDMSSEQLKKAYLAQKAREDEALRTGTYTRTRRELEDTAHDTVNKGKDLVHDGRNVIVDKAHDVRNASKDYVQDAKRIAEEKTQQIGDKVSEFGSQAKDKVRETSNYAVKRGKEIGEDVKDTAQKVGKKVSKEAQGMIGALSAFAAARRHNINNGLDKVARYTINPLTSKLIDLNLLEAKQVQSLNRFLVSAATAALAYKAYNAYVTQPDYDADFDVVEYEIEPTSRL